MIKKEIQHAVQCYRVHSLLNTRPRLFAKHCTAAVGVLPLDADFVSTLDAAPRVAGLTLDGELLLCKYRRRTLQNCRQAIWQRSTGSPRNILLRFRTVPSQAVEGQTAITVYEIYTHNNVRIKQMNVRITDSFTWQKLVAERS